MRVCANAYCICIIYYLNTYIAYKISYYITCSAASSDWSTTLESKERSTLPIEDTL